ncbi:MAG: ACP S-malonyltransferase [Bacteroidota bacterium]
MKNALLFSGQGSQYVGMVRDLAVRYPGVDAIVKRADEILGFELSKICFEGPVEVLKETRYTQPALFVHEAVLIHLLQGKLPFDAVAGHSLGEYSAMHAAGVLTFEEALKLVALRGNLMFRAGEKQPGTMFAVIGLADEKVEEICQSLSKDENSIIVAANYNSPGQVVISGSADYLRENAAAFKTAGARMVTELPVSGAFHSPLMQSAKEELAEAIHKTDFEDANADVYVNVSAQPIRKAEALKEALIQQLVSPVRWTQIVTNMQNAGITKFYEIGPGKVLQGLLKRTLKDAESAGFDTVEDIEKFFLAASETAE